MEKSNQPLVSIVIPCYNHENFVQDCIQSVIEQTYENIELIIIDDGSKDNSVLKIQEMLEKCQNRFKQFEFRYRPNKGLSETLNESLEWCQGKYYSVLASDDQMFDNKTALQVAYLEKNKDCVGCFGGYQLIDENNIVTAYSKKDEKSYSFNEIFLHKHDLPAPTQMLLLNKLKEIGGYRIGIIIEDWYMWLKLAKIGKLHYISEYLAFYRNHSDNMSKKIEIMHLGRNQVLDMYSNEKLYKIAKKEIFWIYMAELKNIFFSKFVLEFSLFSLRNPIFFLKKIFSKIFIR